MRGIVAAAVFISAAASVAVLASVPGGPRAGAVVDDGDVQHQTWTWDVPRQPGGHPLAYYRWQVWVVDTGLYREGTTKVTQATVDFDRKVLGGEFVYLRVEWVSTKGRVGVIGDSPHLYIEPLPVPPIAHADSLKLYFEDAEYASVQHFGMTVGETVTLCGIEWANGLPRIPLGSMSWEVDSDALSIEVVGVNCARFTALYATEPLEAGSNHEYKLALARIQGGSGE
jgi:hypothetical protein